MTDRVKAACEACYAAHTDDCSGFARAVAKMLGVPLEGNANEIVGTLRSGGAWLRLADGVAAAASAKAGNLVLAGLRGDEQHHRNEHGHVVVVVESPLPLAHDKYPNAYWGSLGGTPGKNQSLNYAWSVDDRDRVTYAAHTLPPAAATDTQMS